MVSIKFHLAFSLKGCLIGMGPDRKEFYRPYFEAQGYYDWKVTVARKEVVGRIYPHDLDKFASWDQNPVKERFPSGAHVLSIHGMEDKTVPP